MFPALVLMFLCWAEVIKLKTKKLKKKKSSCLFFFLSYGSNCLTILYIMSSLRVKFICQKRLSRIFWNRQNQIQLFRLCLTGLITVGYIVHSCTVTVMMSFPKHCFTKQRISAGLLQKKWHWYGFNTEWDS